MGRWDYVDHDAGFVGTYFPVKGAGCGCVVISGSEGGDVVSRILAQALAAEGVASLGIGYHGIDELRPTLAEVPLDGFADAARWLQTTAGIEASELTLVGLSRGSEAAMLTAARFPDAAQRVAGIVPGNVCLQSWPPGGPAWLIAGEPLPYAETFGPEASDPASVIPAERIGRLLLVSAGQDELWPSGAMAEAIVARRAGSGLATEHVHLEDASHLCVVLPDSEGTPTPAWDAIVGFARA